MCPITPKKTGIDLLLEAAAYIEAYERNLILDTTNKLLIDNKENVLIGNVKEKQIIGPNGSTVSNRLYQNIKWNNPSAATRKLIASLFSIEVLGTHSLSGKPSPAFIGRAKPKKKKLDAKKVEDVIYIVRMNCGVSAKEVRAAITTKCADTAKKLRKMYGKG